MKKAISLMMALALCLSLCACGSVSLTAEQQSAKDLADNEFKLLCENVSGNTFSSSVKVIDGNYVYVVHLDSSRGFTADTAQTFSDLMFPALCDILCETDIHPVLYLGDQFRIIDTPHLDANILD